MSSRYCTWSGWTWPTTSSPVQRGLRHRARSAPRCCARRPPRRALQEPAPTYPRYIAAYELESPAVLQSAEWKTAGEAGRWAKKIRPHTMNRHLAMYEWVGSNAGLTYRTPYVFWVFMDVEQHREDLFNELYDAEHVPLLLKLPGCVNVARYRTEMPGEPRYLAAYEVDRTDLPMSKLWNDTSDIGRWKPEVRPYTYNKHYIVGERIWPRS